MVRPAILSSLITTALLVASGAAATADAVQYSPYAGDAFPDQVFFGDTHLHTANSADAGMVGNILGPDAAYRFARGEEVTSSNGQQAQLQEPLDFLVITDHSDNLGLAMLARTRNAEFIKTEFGATITRLVNEGTAKSASEAFDTWVRAKVSGEKDNQDPMAPQADLMLDIWHKNNASAETFHQPGIFTTLIGYEFTAQLSGNNLHRNVIYRDGRALADQIMPLSTYQTNNPEDLWDWMESYQDKTGGSLLAIPHNGNMSSGLMFSGLKFDGKTPIDRAYAERRMRFEPLYEVTQMKGDGEAHSALSQADMFADFETWDIGGFGSTKHTPQMLPNEYAREAFKRGLAYEKNLGVNPFKVGMIGSTDSHTSLSTTTEDNFFGKVSMLEPAAAPIRFEEPIAGRENPDPADKRRGFQTGASGLAGVWAPENTREAIFDAFERKEVYATTGTRLRVRVFAGWEFDPADLDRSDFAKHGYSKGVPMGGDLSAPAASTTPELLIRAMRDANGANLDRIQVIKGWLDADGKTYERVYDVAWSGERSPGEDGKLPVVGNTVNVAKASYDNSIGAAYLQAYWQDPDFNPAQSAFYYVRVLEIPTPRWTTIDSRVFGVKRPEGVPTAIQERAYTSPIWYTPVGIDRH